MTKTSALFADRGQGRFHLSPAVNNILADRVLDDLIQRLDAVRELHERADTTDALWRAQTLVDDALRQATNFLFELRRQRLGI